MRQRSCPSPIPMKGLRCYSARGDSSRLSDHDYNALATVAYPLTNALLGSQV